MSAITSYSTGQFAALVAAWALYGAVHSLLASSYMKARIARHWPRLTPSAYRLGFNIFAMLLLIPPLGLTHALGGEPLWTWRGPLAWLAHGVTLLAIAGFVWTSRYYDMREFIGLPATAARASTAQLCFSPLHRYVRHPWYFLGLLILWTREMHAAGLVTAVVLTVYLWIGSQLEERKLIAQHGEAYRRYRAKVPGLLPLPWRHLSVAEAQTLGGTPHDRGSTPFP